MSLYKQLWIAIIFLLSTVFGIAFLINGVSTSKYLEQQLSQKNSDDAGALALSLSQQELDPVLIELQLASRLDQGHYKFIAFTDISGETLFRRDNPKVTLPHHEWLAAIFPINAETGESEVLNGWSQMGTVTVASDDSFAYAELWHAGERTLVALLAAVILAGALGSLLLRAILRPLAQVVEQAEAIGKRRFMNLPEPFTTEFKVVTMSMNTLSARVKDMLTRESQRLERQREVSDLDSTTGILQREAFMARLKAKLSSEGTDASGAIALVRVTNLARMNQTFGRGPVDTTLKTIGIVLRRLTMTEPNWVTGRLNGSDFVLLAPEERDPRKVASTLQRVIADALLESSMRDKTTLPGACVEYASGDTISRVMTTLDAALMAADEKQDSSITLASRHSGSVVPAREQANFWRDALSQALESDGLILEFFPVLTNVGKLFHQEGMVRIRVNNELCPAGAFMPWIHRLDLGGELDRAVVKLAIKQIQRTGHATAINLTANALIDPTFSTWLEGALLKHKIVAERLNLEVNEASAYSHIDGFQRLSRRIQAAGAKLGIEHMGYRIDEVGKLSELGIDYIKIDGLFTNGISNNAGTAALLRTYINIGQTLGLPCIAEGIVNSADLQVAYELGASAASGPAVK